LTLILDVSDGTSGSPVESLRSSGNSGEVLLSELYIVTRLVGWDESIHLHGHLITGHISEDIDAHGGGLSLGIVEFDGVQVLLEDLITSEEVLSGILLTEGLDILGELLWY